MTASQFPVAMRLNTFLRWSASKSSLPATRMFAPGYNVRSSVENWPSMWLGTVKRGFARQSQAFQLHGGGDHRVRFART